MKRGETSRGIRNFKEGLDWLLAEARGGMSIQRYKGLGEMNPEQLWETTMDPTKRILLKVQIEDAISAENIFSTLMGEEVEPRRQFIETNALRGVEPRRLGRRPRQRKRPLTRPFSSSSRLSPLVSPAPSEGSSGDAFGGLGAAFAFAALPPFLPDFAARSSIASSSVTVVIIFSSGSVALTLPCFTYGPYLPA